MWNWNCQIVVGLLFGLWLSGWQSIAVSPPLFNGTCPNLTTVKPVFPDDWYFGTWYLYAQIPLLTETNKKCVTLKIYKVNSTIYFDAYGISTVNGQIFKELGYIVFDEDLYYVLYVHPLEFTKTVKALDFGADFLATYTCEECGFYGQQGGGIHPRIFTKTPKPNCTVTDPIWELLGKSNISKDALELMDFEGCQPLFDYLETH